MSRILLVGTATLDLVFELDHHPEADEEMRRGRDVGVERRHRQAGREREPHEASVA